ncbi:MAG: HipA domain-containing protein [Deltaproteobacteria bacterium]|nr:HipA domain-containing protein [Deltaproteobacteria bacterium]
MKLLVRWRDAIVGELSSSDGGRTLRFRYASATGPQVSHSLPRTLDEQDGTFFANLLPEGQERERLARALGASPDSALSLLAAVGGDCAGALELLPFGETNAPPPRPDRVLTSALTISLQVDGALSTIVREGLRLSLAGAQEKVPVIVAGSDLVLPGTSSVSTHILKLPSKSFRGVIENEHFVMRVARKAGLIVPTTTLWRLPTEDVALLVDRFDRRGGRRLHQEDLCQATGRAPHEKYEADGGPTLAEIVAVLRAACARPAADIERLLRWQAFNVIVGNNDAHAKNVALVREPEIGLSPAYDLVCTRAWPALSSELALRVGGRRQAGDVDAEAWRLEARTCGVGAGLVLDLVADTCERVRAHARATAEELMDAALGKATPIRAALAHIEKQVRWSERALARAKR